MKQILTFILLTFLCLPSQAQEKIYTVDNIPKVHLQNKLRYVCNPADILSQAACDSIDRIDRKSTRLNSSHSQQSRMPSSA